MPRGGGLPVRPDTNPPPLPDPLPPPTLRGLVSRTELQIPPPVRSGSCWSLQTLTSWPLAAKQGSMADRPGCRHQNPSTPTPTLFWAKSWSGMHSKGVRHPPPPPPPGGPAYAQPLSP